MPADTEEILGDDFDENDMDPLDVIMSDAYMRRADAEATAKAFRAVEDISEVLKGVVDGKRSILGSEVFVGQLRKLAQTAEDYYTMSPESHA